MAPFPMLLVGEATQVCCSYIPETVEEGADPSPDAGASQSAMEMMMKKKTRCTFLLVGLFAFWAGVPPASAQRGSTSSSEERTPPPSVRPPTPPASSSSEEHTPPPSVPLPTPPAMKCPTYSRGRRRDCGAKCASHSNCPGEEMCCKSGCEQKCTLPINVNPGYCPSSKPHPPESCDIKCANDNECGKGKKCCRWGCLAKCVDAVPENPGVCPKIDAQRRFSSCPNKCDDDQICNRTQKCCFTGCGRECVDLEKGTGKWTSRAPELEMLICSRLFLCL